MSRSPFLDEEGAPRLARCAVLFFDLLGVSAAASGQAAEAELRHFDETIRQALPYRIGEAAREKPSRYPATVFSDSVIVAVPVEDDMTSTEALFRLIIDINQLQHTLAGYRYFGRGAITFGRLHFHDGLVFGPALVKAVELERTVAREPRIVLSPVAVDALSELPGEEDPAGHAARSQLLTDKDGVVFVDYLAGALQVDPSFDLAGQLTIHRDVVIEELERNQGNSSRWSKYRWVADYHDSICTDYDTLLDGGADAYKIGAPHTTPIFTRLLD
jgi:hypothetical protein